LPNAPRPEIGIPFKKEAFIFCVYSATPSGQTMAEPAAARSFADYLLGQSSNAPNPFGCSFFMMKPHRATAQTKASSQKIEPLLFSSNEKVQMKEKDKAIKFCNFATDEKINQHIYFTVFGKQ
jgi:hypothetical protein